MANEDTGGQQEEKDHSHGLNTSTESLLDPPPFTVDDEDCFCSFLPQRYLVTFLALFGFFNAYALRVNLSVALVAMVNNVTRFGHNIETKEAAEFNWDTKLQGVVLGSFFFGYIVTQLPGGFLASKYGGKNLFGGGVLFASILTMLTPVATRVSVYLLIVLRILEGICQGVIYSSNHTVMSHWAPVLERSRMVALSTSGSFIGTVFTLPVSGILIKWYGWPAVFYFFGVLGILWSLLWFLMVTDSPSDHPKISKKELKYIESSLNGESTKDKVTIFLWGNVLIGGQKTKMGVIPCFYTAIGIIKLMTYKTNRTGQGLFVLLSLGNGSVPWESILSSGPVWAIVAAHFSQNWGYYTLLTTLPTYLKKVLNIELLATGFLSSLPYLVMTCIIYLAGLLSDFLRSKEAFTTTCVRKFCICTGFFFQAIFLVLVGHVTDKGAAITLLSLGVGMGGLIWSGFGVNHIDIAPRYSGLLMGITNFFATIPGIVGPPIAGVLTPNETVTEWRMVFYISGGVSVFGLIVYFVLGSGEKQKWNDNEYKAVPASPLSSPK